MKRRASDGRSYTCECGGVVKARRRQKLEDVERIHNETCSARRNR